MAASSSAVAVNPGLHKYDVFVSFRGEIRNSFTSHLYSALCQKQIKAYIDEVSLEKGDDISRALPKAIKESAISIIIFSKHYASSCWCLEELVYILKCKKKRNQIVLPIFYGIDPSHIRHQKETYAAAFFNHQGRFKDKMMQEWRQALTTAADLSGWDSRGKSESVLVRKVVEHVRKKLDTIWSINSDNLNGPVGIRRRIEKIESLLRHSDIVGICGMGGIGKTTLATAVFERMYNQFDGSYFAANVREESNNKGLPTLANEVFSKLLNEKNIDASKSEVNVRLRRIRLLLVLDDIDKVEQLKVLVGHRDRFGRGSKIIVTSRDLQVIKHIVDETYEAEELNSDEVQEFFYSNASKRSMSTEFTEIRKSIVRKAKGNPLALGVLCSSLCPLSIKDCHSALAKLKRTPHEKIQNVLRLSYDGLDSEEQDIFLDIACFLKDKRRDFVEGILEHKPLIGLVHKFLITIDQDGLIRMHDLIQEMGWEIVRQSTKKLGERSRLWTAEDVSNVLENNKGTEAIEGIYLPWNKEDEELHLRPDVFEKMCNLRLLKICNRGHSCEVKVHIDGDLKYLPNGLRYLQWEYYPGKSLPPNFKPHNLVELHMPYSNLEQLWDGVKKLGSLKHINLYHSKLLTKIADLSLAPKLESINLCGCNNLKTLPKLSENLQVLRLDGSGIEQIPASSFECLSSLHKLSLKNCRSLKSLPSNIWKLKALEQIDLSHCSNLRNLPEIENQSEHLWKLNLEYTSIQKLPSSIENLIQLRDLNLSECVHLEFIPKSLCKLTRLERFSLDFWVPHCSKLKKFTTFSGLCSLTQLDLSNCNIRDIPDWLGSLTSLVSLHLQRNFFERIPSSIRKLHKLTWLDISVCHNLQSLPELPLFIEYVNADDCSSLEMVSTSRFPLTRERWLHNYDCLGNSRQRFRQFSFLNCSKLDENRDVNFIHRVGYPRIPYPLG